MIHRLRLAVALALAVAASGCYTLLRHPGMSQLNYRRPESETPCTSCHAREELLSFVQSRRVAAEPDPWGRLAHPWWIAASADTARSDGGQTR
jgi:hypothetical protein